eukprot:Nitzschia sp. Nitz4//scaffold78_size91513//5222//5800//NITZ4_004912-RA/size91513-processed-gene-0.80-mRNA-1//-1//CDS//3329558079//5521//frame0
MMKPSQSKQILLEDPDLLNSPATAALATLSFIPKREEQRVKARLRKRESSTSTASTTDSDTNHFDMSELFNVTLTEVEASSETFPLIEWNVDEPLADDDQSQTCSVSDPGLLISKALRRNSCSSTYPKSMISKRRRHSAAPRMTDFPGARPIVRSMALCSNLSTLETSSMAPLQRRGSALSVSSSIDPYERR